MRNRHLVIFLLIAVSTLFVQHALCQTNLLSKELQDREITVAGLPATLNNKNINDPISTEMMSVRKGQVISITGSESYSRKGSPSLALAKGAGVGSIIYEGPEARTSNGKGPDSRKSKALIPAISIGVAATLRDLLTISSRPQAYLSYYLYDKNKNLVSSGSERISRKAKNRLNEFDLYLVAPADGYIKVTYSNKSKTTALLNNLVIRIRDLNPEKKYKGSIANSMNAESNSGCLDTIYIYEECDPQNPEYDLCWCIPDACYDPCFTNPYSCDCDPSNCDPIEDPDPCTANPFSCECSDYAYDNSCECYSVDCEPPCNPSDPSSPCYVPPRDPVNGDTLVNNLDSLPCFKGVLDSIAALPATDSIGKLFNELNNLGTDFDVTLKFQFNSSLASDIDGDTKSTGASSYQTNTINLNTILTSSSQEYKAITMMHEIIHAYINTISTYRIFDPSFSNITLEHKQELKNQGYSGEALSHELMARYFIDDMVYSLQQLFPGMSTERATALAWGGLAETSVWAAKSDTEKNNILNINSQEKYHQSGATGTFCN